MGAGKDERVGKAAEWSQTEDLTGYKAPEPMGSQAWQCVFLIPMLSSRRKKKRCKIPGSLLAQPPGYSVTTRKFSHQHLGWSSDPTERREKWGGKGEKRGEVRKREEKPIFGLARWFPLSLRSSIPGNWLPQAVFRTPHSCHCACTHACTYVQ